MRRRSSTLWFNKIVLLILLISVLLSGLTGASAAESRDADLSAAIRLTIVHTNDTHSRVKEGDGIGFAKISTIIKDIKSENPNTLVLDAGDTLHGQTFATLTRGESIIRIMNEIGYDAMTPGNHDFNYGYERLLELNELADFPILTANITKEDGGSLLDAYVIIEIAGLRVGIFGLSTPETSYKTHPNNVKGLTFEDPVEAAKEIIEALDDETDIIIALAHLGTWQKLAEINKLKNPNLIFVGQKILLP